MRRDRKPQIDRGALTILGGLLLLDIVAGISSRSYPTQATPMAVVGVVLGFLILRSGLRERATTAATPAMADDEQAIRRDNAMLSYGLGIALLGFGAFFTFYNIINTLTQPIKDFGQVKVVDIALIVVFNALVIGLEYIGYRAYRAGRTALQAL